MPAACAVVPWVKSGNPRALYRLTFNAKCYKLFGVVRSFRCRETEKVFLREFTRRFQGIARVAKRRLDQLHAATSLADLAAIPGNRLEALAADRAGQHSVRINKQWRICFRWNDGDAFDIEIVDYH